MPNEMKINKDLIVSDTNYTLGDIPFVDVYSTTETKTNKVWIDGKPIYRKVFVYTGTIRPSAADVVVANLSDVNPNTWVSVNMIAVTDGNVILPVPAANANLNYVLEWWLSGNTIKIGTGASRTLKRVHTIVEYTK